MISTSSSNETANLGASSELLIRGHRRIAHRNYHAIFAQFARVNLEKVLSEDDSAKRAMMGFNDSQEGLSEEIPPANSLI